VIDVVPAVAVAQRPLGRAMREALKAPDACRRRFGDAALLLEQISPKLNHHCIGIASLRSQ